MLPLQGGRLCERQRGQYSELSTETTCAYVCQAPAEVGVPFVPFSSRDLEQASKLCVRNGGVFASDSAAFGYSCTFTI